MKDNKIIFGEAPSVVDQSRTKPTGMIAKNIETKNNKKVNVRPTKKAIKGNIKKPNNFSK